MAWLRTPANADDVAAVFKKVDELGALDILDRECGIAGDA